MIGVIEAVLAGVGVVFLFFMVLAATSKKSPASPPTEDLAAPYREGLHAANRMQRVAQDLEQQIYAEAMRQAEDEAAGRES